MNAPKFSSPRGRTSSAAGDQVSRVLPRVETALEGDGDRSNAATLLSAVRADMYSNGQAELYQSLEAKLDE